MCPGHWTDGTQSFIDSHLFRIKSDYPEQPRLSPDFLNQFDSETGLRSPGVHLLPDYLIRRGAQPGLGGDQPMGTGICYGNWNYDVETRKNTV